MMRWRGSWRWAFVVALSMSVGACTSPDAMAGPEEDRVAIPQFTEAACAEWSCSWNICTYDPAVYGACCTQAAGGEYTATPKPSCDAPPPPSGVPEWCGTTPRTACMIKKSIDLTYYADCTTFPSVGSGDAYYPECTP